ncbi:hypothetical protein [Streptomyces sp. NPDC005538]|uniref:hypothetical protein n=1 Tax=Streptomyces sp. NPDC005538 TaxID=3157043 RepID=UPI0033BA81CB
MNALHCLFCGVAVRGRREHVLPSWFLKRHNGQGPFTTEVDGEPVAYASGVVERDHLSRWMLPVCGKGEEQTGGQDCNGWLNTVFEQPAKIPVRAALDDLEPVNGPAVRAIARWSVKTLLLAAHPDLVHSAAPQRGRSAWEFPQDWLPGLRTTGDLPADLSLWLGVIDPSADEESRVPDEQLLLPRIHHPHAAGGPGQATNLGFGLPDGRMAQFQLLSHPAMDITHPAEEAGLVVKLWPQLPDRLDINALPVLSREDSRRISRTFVRGGTSIDLMPEQTWLPEGLLSPRVRIRLAPTPSRDRLQSGHTNRSYNASGLADDVDLKQRAPLTSEPAEQGFDGH